MLPSLYNVVAPSYDGAGHILYNTRSQACVLLDDDEIEAYREACVQPEAGRPNAAATGADGAVEDEASEGEPEDELTAQLADMGFFVDDARVEYNFSRYEHERNKFENSMLSLRICPTLDFDRAGSQDFGLRREGSMSREVQDALAAFVEEQNEHQPYNLLIVTWILDGSREGLDTAAYLTGQFMDFVERSGVAFETHAEAVGGADVRALREALAPLGVEDVETPQGDERCKHETAQPTPDQDFVHKAKDGSREVLAELGFLPHLRQDHSRPDAGKPAGAGLEIASGGTNFGAADLASEAVFKQRAMRLMDDFLAQNPTREDFEAYLTPLTSYCDAGVERAYTIDERGNVYDCAYDLGREERVLFNVCEPMESRAINMKLISKFGNSNPLDHQECATCRVFPLCQGGCARVRVEEGMLTCVPQRYLIEEYLTAYSRVL